MPAWIPNAISMVRIALVPVWLWLAFSLRGQALTGSSIDRSSILGVFVALGLSDIVDGFIARRFKLTSNRGATLDAVADKLAQVASVSFLVWLGAPAFTPLPLWLWIALVLRDGVLAIGWLLIFRRHRAVQVEHRWHGKASSLVLFGVVLAGTAAVPSWVIDLGSALAAALIVPGTVAYVREGWRQFNQPNRQ
jgi:cardiolipin synthase